jgi:single-strand DNA-binding protein
MSQSMTVIGNLAADPELRFTAQGKAVCEIVIATSKSKRNDDGTWDNGTPTYWTVKAWDSLGENIAESLRKGDPVIAFGVAEWRAWENKDGSKGGKMEINAWHIGYDLKKAPVTVTRQNRPSNGTVAPPQDPWTTESTLDAPPF